MNKPLWTSLLLTTALCACTQSTPNPSTQLSAQQTAQTSAQRQMAQCKPLVRDMASVYIYGLLCADNPAIKSLFSSPTGEQAGQNLLDKIREHCQNIDEDVAKEAEDEIFKQSDVQAIAENPEQDTTAFCQGKASVVEAILQRYQ